MNNTQSTVNNGKTGGAVDSEVTPRATRRQFSAAYKQRILAEAEACTEPGQVGALLRREGLYSSHLTKWRRQRTAGKLDNKQAMDAATEEITALKAENERLKRELARASLIIDAQKKLVEVFGLSVQENEPA